MVDFTKKDCILKDICGSSGPGCNLDYLVNYCQPTFITSKNGHFCSICGRNRECCFFNRQHVCGDCIISIVFPRIARMTGIGENEIIGISRRIEI